MTRIASAGGAVADAAALLEATTDFSAWTPLPAGSSPFPFNTNLPKEFFRLRK